MRRSMRGTMLGKNLLIKELPNLVRDEVITQESAERVKAYYEKMDGSRSNLLLILFGVLGAVLVGGGIILLLAHNWDDLPRWVRTLLALAPLVTAQALCAYALLKRHGSTAWSEASSAFLVLAVGTAISLISQTYNIYGDMGRFILTWTLLAGPVVYLMGSTSAALFYLTGVASWIGIRGFSENYPWAFWPLAAAIIPFYYNRFRAMREGVRFTILTWALVIFSAFCLMFLLPSGSQGREFGIYPGFSILAYAALYAALYLAGLSSFYEGRNLLSNPALMAGSLGIPGMVLFFTFIDSWKNLETQLRLVQSFNFSGAGLIGAATVGAMALPALVLLGLRVRGKNYDSLPFGIGFPVFAAGYAVLMAGGSPVINQVLFNLYCAALGIYTVVRGAREVRLLTVNFGMIILGGLVISRFFDGDLSFVARGAMFILFGAGFLLVNVLIVRRRKEK